MIVIGTQPRAIRGCNIALKDDGAIVVELSTASVETIGFVLDWRHAEKLAQGLMKAVEAMRERRDAGFVCKFTGRILLPSEYYRRHPSQ